jgi:DNA-binding NarL/FixJ family response regulator
MTTGATDGTSPPSTLGFERESGLSRRVSGGVSIVLIDRRSLTRQCLGQWLQDGSPDLHVVSVGSPGDLLNISASLGDPHIIIFSIGAASIGDREVLGMMTLLRCHMSRIPLVILSDRDDIDDIVEAMGHGVRGYIPTSLEPSEAAAALQYVAAGGTFVPASAMIKFAQARQQESHRGPRDVGKRPFESLTPRESEVLARLRQGKPNKVIAYELQISEGTVKVFVRRILTKLHASNRTEAASLVRQQPTIPEISTRVGDRTGSF